MEVEPSLPGYVDTFHRQLDPPLSPEDLQGDLVPHLEVEPPPGVELADSHGLRAETVPAEQYVAQVLNRSSRF